MRKRERKYVGKLNKRLFIKVTLPPFDRYILCQLASSLSILPTTSSQMNLALKGAPNKRPRYFKGREETLQPKIPAKSSILTTLPTGTSTDLARLIFKPETASKKKKNNLKKMKMMKISSSKKLKYCQQTIKHPVTTKNH
jgi:hypothetical protein